MFLLFNTIAITHTFNFMRISLMHNCKNHKSYKQVTSVLLSQGPLQIFFTFWRQENISSHCSDRVNLNPKYIEQHRACYQD